MGHDLTQFLHAVSQTA